MLTVSLMRTVAAGLAFVLALVAVAASATADSLSDEGTLIRLDPPSRVVMLEDGRMYRAVAGTSFVVESRTETFDRLRPGARIVVIGGEPVIYRQGRYIALPAVPPSLGLAVVPPPEGTVFPSTAASPGVSAGMTPPSAEPPTLQAGTVMRSVPAAAALLPAAPIPSQTPPTTWRPAGIVQSPSHIFPTTHTVPTTQSSP